MEIKFLLPNQNIVKSPYDFGDYYKETNINYYLRLKGLEYNSKFVKDIEAIRKKKDLNPEKLSKELLQRISKSFFEIAKQKDPSLPYSYPQLMREMYKDLIDDFLKILKIDSLYELTAETRLAFNYLNTQKSYGQTYINSLALVEILLFETIIVKSGLPHIYWTPEDLETGLPYIAINLNADISKQEALDYINRIFDKEIKPAIKRLEMQDKDKFALTERDLIILDARMKQKLKFREIADLLTEKYGYKNINEDLIKKAYNRAKKKVEDL
jgi:hypothetical protein